MSSLLDAALTIGILVWLGLWMYTKRTGKSIRELIKEVKRGIE